MKMKRSIKLVILTGLLVLSAGLAYAESTINLPQTGQTTCYDEDGNVIDCTGTGQDGEIRAGVEWPSTRFFFSGNCVTDNLTGLMWVKNTLLINGGFSFDSWDEAVSYANDADLCGHLDWRLPNINELESLANAGVSSTAVWLQSLGFFPEINSWSSTSYASSMYPLLYAWLTETVGFPVWTEKKSQYLIGGWMVRGGQQNSPDPSYPANLWKTGQTESYATGDDGDLEMGVLWPNPRFVDNGNETVTDNLTGLVWTKDMNTPGPSTCSPETSKGWQESLDHVKCLNTNSYLGYTDWRFPNRKELRSLIDYSKTDPALPAGHPFTDVQFGAYWTSTTEISYSNKGAWIVLMGVGSLKSGAKPYHSYKLWPVRGPVVSQCNDSDGDGYGNPGDASCPNGIATDCDNNDATIYPGALEVCDRKDNDCNPATADGSEEVWVGEVCDGIDSDLCMEGTYSCSGGQRVCSDNTGDNIEICDGLDNDCNTVTPDGSAEAWIGDPCDGPDSDLCSEGIFICTGGQKACSDTTDDTIEVCDNIDNDCDGQVDEDLPILTFYYDGDDDGFGDRNKTKEGCGPSADYVADSSDCDDSDPGIGSCNTPPGSDTVTVTDPATGTEITFPNVENGGNTTVVSSDVGADPPPNFQLGDFEYSYYDINCQTGDGSDCTWSHSSFVLVCFTWEEGDFSFDDFVRIFQENETGGWDDVTCIPGFGDCPDPNPNTENYRVCAYVDHLSWFGVFQNIGLEISLVKGLNFISYAGEIPSGLSSHDLLKQLGTPDTIKRILTYSPTSGTYSVSFYDTEGNPAGDDGMVTNFWALQVYAKQQQDARFFYTSLCQQPTPLIKGRNEAGFNCIPPGYSAYTFLQDIGQSAVVSVQRFNKITGLFETASFKDSAPVGVDFPMQEGEGYLVFMKQNYVWIAPAP